MGSSPHTRGARRRLSARRHGPGIIPAYAGSTATAAEKTSLTPDHPRIRGEHLPTEGGRHFRRRIIPAYAGSTNRVRLAGQRRQDHPRIRGEHRPIPEHCQMAEGSSPHTRGALPGMDLNNVAIGIIPAYAGSTDGPHTTSRAVWDHPRIRGEHGVNTAGEYARPGSSPHTRGARAPTCIRRRRRGIIPAYAGSTAG